MTTRPSTRRRDLPRAPRTPSSWSTARHRPGSPETLGRDAPGRDAEGGEAGEGGADEGRGAADEVLVARGPTVGQDGGEHAGVEAAALGAQDGQVEAASQRRDLRTEEPLALALGE